jgi:hypothetical protein
MEKIYILRCVLLAILSTPVNNVLSIHLAALINSVKDSANKSLFAVLNPPAMLAVFVYSFQNFGQSNSASI